MPNNDTSAVARLGKRRDSREGSWSREASILSQRRDAIDDFVLIGGRVLRMTSFGASNWIGLAVS